ncbi:hypothetical protein CYLTODRAFT_409350 [Cylindrobasidium torrendii FP15055 ss-10]|uniref:GATA-type domain-containing protein n=1 Tax=Cylindrobasidium torrendii FP15055 ss-10 TaxID=1314674 RepID=A0A0D7BHU5_9AGAR|nr:hypothetical protein CYLTODRAFT_409350 [Cylindrobasidium torrendii FP15055 ss-10]
MPNILNLKFKGNKSFVAFSNLQDTEALAKTWKVCTKVASYLEQGQRLENLSWRLWHLQNLIVDTDNAKSKREFKKLSKVMGDKLDKEKGRSIEELEAPDYRRTHSTDILKQRAEEKERNREASQNAQPGTMNRMQFTFSVDQPFPAVNAPVRKPDLKPSPEFTKRPRPVHRAEDQAMAVDEAPEPAPAPFRNIRLPNFLSDFSDDFGPNSMLHATPTLTTQMNYSHHNNHRHDGYSYHDFGIMRPTIELPLDELLNSIDSRSVSPPSMEAPMQQQQHYAPPPQMQPSASASSSSDSSSSSGSSDSNGMSDDSSSESDDDRDADFMSPLDKVPPIADVPTPTTVAPSKLNAYLGNQLARSNTPIARPQLTVRTSGTTTRSGNPSATATNQAMRAVSNTNNNTAPGGVKAECSNCGATHTPLWRRGLNDELNCNACGLYCKLHKRPRPKTMRNSHGEGRTQSAPRQESVDVMAQCYNCHTTTTPLWRKDDEGKTVCNACGLYYKLHGSARPISMKSDVIRKRSRHDARRNSNAQPPSSSDTPSASPGVSRRTSPSPAREASPTLAPDSTTQMSYEFNNEQHDYNSSQSELMGALGAEPPLYSSMFGFQFPGPYHPDTIASLINTHADPLPFAAGEFESDHGLSERKNKRRRMSIDSASEPPSSAVSYSSFEGYSSASSNTSHSRRSSLSEFPFSSNAFSNGSSSSINNTNSTPAIRGNANATFWHPPLMLNDNNSPQFHPPMLPQSDDSPMDYLAQPHMHDEENFFSAYLHPPMSLPEDTKPNMSMYTQSGDYDTQMRGY